MQPQTLEGENVSLRAEVDRLRERETASREILAVISRNREDERPVLDAVTQNSVKLCDAAGAGLWLLNSDGDVMTLVSTAQNHDQKGEAVVSVGLEFPMENKSLMGQCFRDARTMSVADNQEDAYYLDGDPTARKLVDKVGMRSRLIVPLLEDGVAFGCISIHRKEVRVFSDEEVMLIESFAEQAVIAIENVRQFKALELLNAKLSDRVDEQVDEIERMARLKRFLPTAVADTVISRGADKMLSSHRALLGVLFCDIRGFTAFCETAEPEETIEVLQTYHEEMGRLINSHGAGVDHRMGDGIMVLFNDPLPCEDPAGEAARLAIAMRAQMVELCSRWKRMGYRLGFGVGVSLGYATVGMVGFEGRFDYTASGTAINLASRLCDEAVDGEILLSPRAAIAVENELSVETKGNLSFKGIREPLEVFRLTEAIQ